MKKFRKGFTLLELLVVIGVMGIMSSLAMVAGQQATDAARANNIADGLEKAASAMMMYYADKADVIAISGETAENIAKGANVYLKQKSALVHTGMSATEAIGKYAVHVVGAAPAQTWWLIYTLPDTDIPTIGPIMKNKAERMGLKNDLSDEASDYNGEQKFIYMRVR